MHLQTLHQVGKALLVESTSMGSKVAMTSKVFDVAKNAKLQLEIL